MFTTIYGRFLGLCRQWLYRSRFLQICILIAFWYLGQEIAQTSSIPIPGSIIGLFTVLALLYTGILHISELALGAEWFLAEMLLFFIPAVPAVLNHHEFLGWVGIKVLLIILLGTIIVMLCTAYIVDFCFHHLEKHPPSKQS
ncbi:MAG: CidA/LrgA family protein [Alphaproteobacteria bacterium]|nr:CidA/LrgA family protein [Alphaproteobacteria bacterium]